MAAIVAFGFLGLMTLVFGGLTLREDFLKKAGK